MVMFSATENKTMKVGLDYLQFQYTSNVIFCTKILFAEFYTKSLAEFILKMQIANHLFMLYLLKF